MKKNQAGSISSSDFQYHWNDSQNAYMADLLGRFQMHNNGKEGLQTGLIQNETILIKLSPFTNPTTLTITGGQSNKPSDFIYELALRINGEKVYKIAHDQIYWVNQSVIDPPSIAEDSYYYIEYLNYYKFLPSAVTSAELDYIATPVNIVWGFTFDGNGRQVYNPATSVQPQWMDIDCLEITKRMLKTLGVAFKDADLSNFGQSVITTGE